MQNILIATDLTARSDRAMDRAVRLSRESGARLTVVHALEEVKGIREEANVPSWRRVKPSWQRLDRLSEIAEAQIRADVGELAPSVEVVVRAGSASDLVHQQLGERPFDLLVTGVARDTGWGRVVLGSTVERSIGSGLAPVLVVKRRALAAYERIVVATDFSAASRLALRAAFTLCPDRTIDLLHAYETEEEGMSVQTQGRDDPAYGQATRLAHEFVRPELNGRHHRLVLEPGQPLSLINSYVADHDVELVAIGTHGRTGLLTRLFGSVAERVLLSARCDVLVVRDHGGADSPPR